MGPTVLKKPCHPLEAFCRHSGWGARKLVKTHGNPRAARTHHVMHQQIFILYYMDILLNILFVHLDSWLVEYKWVVVANFDPFDHHQGM